MCGCSLVTVSVVVMLGVTTVLITSLILVSRVATFRDQSVSVKGISKEYLVEVFELFKKNWRAE